MPVDPIDFDHDLKIDVLRREARADDAEPVTVTRGWLHLALKQLERVPVLQAELAGRRTVDVVVAGIVR